MEGEGRRNWMKVVKRYLINIVGNAICYVRKMSKRVNPEFSSQGKGVFFYFFNFVSM